MAAEASTSSGGSSKSDEFYNFFGNVEKRHLPLVYSDKYNISFMGLEKLHPFDRYSPFLNTPFLVFLLLYANISFIIPFTES
jgi:hypothetical protein